MDGAGGRALVREHPVSSRHANGTQMTRMRPCPPQLPGARVFSAVLNGKGAGEVEAVQREAALPTPPEPGPHFGGREGRVGPNGS